MFALYTEVSAANSYIQTTKKMSQAQKKEQYYEEVPSANEEFEMKGNQSYEKHISQKVAVGETPLKKKALLKRTSCDAVQRNIVIAL